MKQLKMHWSAQPLSVLLSVLMALPVLTLFLLQAPMAQAQAPNRQPTWAVLDFGNPSGYGSGDVGRLAADSFVVALGGLNRFTVLPRQQLLDGIQANNLTPPLNLTSIQRLGQALGVDAVVAGEIASISFSRDHRQAKVSLVVRVIDPRSGFLLNGALAEGISNQRPIPVNDEEQLVNEAFANAAFNAVKKISQFNLPVATVLLAGDSSLSGGQKTVTLDKGTRDGLYPGLDMLVTRNGVVTGRIHVSDVTNNEANAVITDLGIGIKPEDRATALYNLPSYKIAPTVGSFQTTSASDVALDQPTGGVRHSSFSGVVGILTALLAAGLLVAAVSAGHHGGDNSLGGAGVSGVQAILGRSADLGGPLNSIPIGSTVSIVPYIPVSVRITSDIGNVSATNFLEFHVYRSDSPPILASPSSATAFGATVTGGTNTGTNTNNNGTNTNNGNNTGLGINGFGQIPLLTQTGSSPLRVFDDLQNKFSVVASKPDPADSSTILTFTLQTTPNTTTGLNAGLPGTALQFGQRVSYSIEGLYTQPSTFGTGVLNPGTNNNGNTGNTNTNTNTNNGNTNGNTNNNNNNNNNGNNNGNNTNNGTNTTSVAGHGITYQLTSRRNTNTVTYIEPVQPAANAVSGTGASNVNVTVPATLGANDYILQISTDPGFSNVHTYQSAPGSFSATAAMPTQGTAVVFNNINLTTDFPGGTSFFYRVGARDSSNGGSTSNNPYVFSDPLQLTVAATPPGTPTGAERANSRKRY